MDIYLDNQTSHTEQLRVHVTKVNTMLTLVFGVRL